MTASSYIALIRKEDNTDFWVDIPDIPGCVSSGETPEAAMKNFEEALSLHLKALMQIPGVELPPPRSLEQVLAAQEDPYDQAYMVDIEAGPQLRLHFAHLNQ
jgi:predicted RNase H-like HicB family nuclease